jgi:hypothetical protein
MTRTGATGGGTGWDRCSTRERPGTASRTPLPRSSRPVTRCRTRSPGCARSSSTGRARRSGAAASSAVTCPGSSTCRAAPTRTPQAPGGRPSASGLGGLGGRRRHLRQVWAAAASVVVVLAVTALAQGLGNRTTAPATPTSGPVLPDVRARPARPDRVVQRPQRGRTAVSPDGTRLATTQRDPDRDRQSGVAPVTITVHTVGDGTALRSLAVPVPRNTDLLTAPILGQNAWSPDGRWLAVEHLGLQSLPVDGSTPPDDATVTNTASCYRPVSRLLRRPRRHPAAAHDHPRPLQRPRHLGVQCGP